MTAKHAPTMREALEAARWHFERLVDEYPTNHKSAFCLNIAKAAIREIDAALDQPAAPGDGWRPIEEAPVEPADKVACYYRYRCLLLDARRYVFEGYAEYTNKKKLLTWKNAQDRVVMPTHFMPLPAPPANPEAQK